MPARVFDIFQELFELIPDTPRIEQAKQQQLKYEQQYWDFASRYNNTERQFLIKIFQKNSTRVPSNDSAMVDLRLNS